MKDVRFRYSPNEPWVLDGVSLDVAAGKRVALVGASGAGKSTIVNLLVRFWDYEGGAITLMGKDLKDWSAEDVRQTVAVVPQRVHLFNATIRDNLLLARPGAGQEQIVGAAEQAQLHGFVQTLPAGYETWAGEQGLRFSGGERQRIGIARALLRRAPLLILDEPASGLDSLTERQILDSLCGSTSQQAILLIAHRLTGLEAMDEIVVLHRGRVAERGTHDELMRTGGLYRRMWELQNSIF